MDASRKLQNGVGTHDVFLDSLQLCSISCSANITAIFETVPCTSQIYLNDFGYDLWNLLSKFFKVQWHRILIASGTGRNLME
jgi:hypothetical protein